MLPRKFFQQDTLIVARQLLGKRLLRREVDGEYTGGIIVETEAYIGEEDLACHARSGPTPRNKIMWAAPGHIYTYFTYGMHWMLNIVTGEAGFPAAVLLRAIAPDSGLSHMRARRNKPDRMLSNGPGKLCQALDIDGRFNGMNLFDPATTLNVMSGIKVPADHIRASSRIGINSVPEPWRSMPWRFCFNSPTQKLQQNHL